MNEVLMVGLCAINGFFEGSPENPTLTKNNLRYLLRENNFRTPRPTAQWKLADDQTQKSANQGT
jgi:hypothetical protein